MKCDYCNQSIDAEQGVVVLTINGDECQRYHAGPRPLDELSCWQHMLLGWGYAIKTSFGAPTTDSHGFKAARLRTPVH